jgi:hypothetical protein
VLGRLEQEVAAAVRGDPVEIDSVAFSSAPVYRFASTRRVLDKNNRCVAVRWPPSLRRHAGRL